MDRHVKWLRRRVIASVATQTAETFAVVAVLVFGVLKWLTNQGPWTALFGSVVIAQLVAAARIAYAMRKNPLNYKHMRRYIDRSFNYRVSRFQGDEAAIHPTAALLPGFVPVATISDAEDTKAPDFGVYHDPSRLVAASVNEASGSLALVSSLIDGRILATIARPMPPHERLVLNVSDDDDIDSVVTSHRRALSGRSDIVELSSSAHQVVLDLLAMEFASYQALGPALSPFLDLESGDKSPFRLAARIKRTELNKLPDLPVNGSAEQFYTPASENEQLARRLRDGIRAMPTDADSAADSDEDDLISETHIGETHIGEPVVRAPLPDAAEVPQIATPPVPTPNIVVPAMAVPPIADVPAGPPTLGTITFKPVVADVSAEVVAEVPATVVVGEPSAEKAATASAVTDGQAADTPLDLTAAIASLSAVSTIATPTSAPAPAPAPAAAAATPAPAPVESTSVPVPAPQVSAPAPAASTPAAAPAPAPAPAAATPAPVESTSVPVPAPAPAASAPAPQVSAPAPAPAAATPAPVESTPVPAPAPQAPAPAAAPVVDVQGLDAVVAPIPNVPAASLAEAVMSAPDTVAALTDATMAEPTPPAAAYPSDVDPVLVPNLSAALGRNDELSPSRPRLSEVIRANSAHSKGPLPSTTKRSRRKSR